MAAFKQAWVKHPGALAIMGYSTYNRLQAEGLPMQIIGQDTRRIVVRKPSSPRSPS